MRAAENCYRNVDSVRMLLDAGADKNAKNDVRVIDAPLSRFCVSVFRHVMY